MNTLKALALLASAVALAACGGSNHPAAAPTATLTVDKSTVNSGETATLTWTSTGATACHATDGWSGDLDTSGSQSTDAITTSTTYSLTCTSGSASSTKSSVTVNLVPTATLTATPASVAAGESAQLNWSSTDATACTASGGWTGALGASGSKSTGAIAASTTYNLTCTGAGGDSAPTSATVTVTTPAGVPTVSISANPATIASGATSMLTWSSTNATTCAASGGWTGPQATSGTQATPALSGTTTFTLTCTGSVGSTSASTTVTVSGSATAAPVVTFNAAPSGVVSGTSSQLIWSTTDATSCASSGGWTGPQPTSGSVTTGALTAQTSFTLSCTGPGGTGNATILVDIVSDKMSPSTVALVISQAQTFNKTLPGTVTYAVDGVAGGNSAVGTVTAAGVYSGGTTVGPHTIRATSTTDATQQQTALAIISDVTGVTTYHGSDQRDGANVHEYALNTSSVKNATFGKLASCTVDGSVGAQPLWVAQQTLGGAKHNVVYVATQHNSLYAFDADSASCTILWQVTMNDTAHGALATGEKAVPWNTVGFSSGYGDIRPEIGIAGTPVIDLPNKIIYLVSKHINAAGTAMYSRLHAIDITTGNEKNGSPVTITGSVPGTGTGASDGKVAFDSHQELQRPGLALANGVVYVAFGAHEDKDPWFGWVFGYRYASNTFTQTALFNTAPDGKGAGIWMSGGAPAIDSGNNLYMLTGNGNFNADASLGGGNDYGDSLLKLTSSLAVSAYWTPQTQDSDKRSDTDFGSGGAAIVADLPGGSLYPRVLVGGGKQGILEVLNRDTLGGYTVGSPVQEIVLGKMLFSTPAYWNSRLYVGAAGNALQMYSLNTSTSQFTLASSSTLSFGWPGTTPAISARGTSDGVVWAMEQNTYCTRTYSGGTAPCGPPVLHAYDALNLATELWKSSTVAADVPGGNALKFTSPMVANGHVYIGTRGNNTGGDALSTTISGTLEIYGLKP